MSGKSPNGKVVAPTTSTENGSQPPPSGRSSDRDGAGEIGVETHKGPRFEPHSTKRIPAE